VRTTTAPIHRRPHRYRPMANMPRKWQVLSLVSVAVFMASLDLFIVNVALPDIQVGLGHQSLSNASWVLSAYAIVFAALLVPAGRLADRIGRKAFFEYGLLIFVVASVLCAAAPVLPVLIGARVLQAVGAACLFPTSLALLLPEFELHERPVAIAIYSAVGGISAALGPPIGGLLVGVSWRLIFLVNVPVGLATLLIGLRVLRESREGEKAAFPDLVGAPLLTAGIASAVGGIVEGQQWGWGSPLIALCFAGSALLIGVFFWRAARHPVPIVDLPMLRVRTFAMASVAQLLYSAAFGAMLLSLVLFLNGQWHYSVLRTGLAIAPGPAVAAICSVPGGKLGQRFGQSRVLVVSTSVVAIGCLWWAWQITLAPHFLSAFLPGMILTGIGVGPTIPNIFTQGVASLEPGRYATGSAVLSMSRQIGAALGVAIFVAVLGIPGPSNVLAAFQRGWIVCAALAASAGLVCLVVGVIVPAFSRRSLGDGEPVRAATTP
jgi:EmrB/QacA subfamily drug resistance transporter